MTMSGGTWRLCWLSLSDSPGTKDARAWKGDWDFGGADSGSKSPNLWGRIEPWIRHGHYHLLHICISPILSSSSSSPITYHRPQPPRSLHSPFNAKTHRARHTYQSAFKSFHEHTCRDHSTRLGFHANHLPAHRRHLLPPSPFNHDCPTSDSTSQQVGNFRHNARS